MISNGKDTILAIFYLQKSTTISIWVSLIIKVFPS